MSDPYSFDVQRTKAVAVPAAILIVEMRQVVPPQPFQPPDYVISNSRLLIAEVVDFFRPGAPA